MWYLSAYSCFATKNAARTEIWTMFHHFECSGNRKCHQGRGSVHLMALRHRERLRGVHLKPQRTTKWNSENGAGPSLGSHHIGQRRLSKNYVTFMPAGTFFSSDKILAQRRCLQWHAGIIAAKNGIKLIKSKWGGDLRCLCVKTATNTKTTLSLEQKM